jgi:hypothetical protein
MRRQNMEHYTLNHGTECGITEKGTNIHRKCRRVGIGFFHSFTQLESKGVRIVATWISKQPLAPLAPLSKGLVENCDPRQQ